METFAALREEPTDFEFLIPTDSSSESHGRCQEYKIDHFLQEFIDQQESPGGDPKRHQWASAMG